MAALIAPGICRYTVNGLYEGRPIANILDINLSDLVGGSREEACAWTAGDFLNQWNDEILPLVSSQYTAVSVSWLDLDSLTGSTGEVTTTDGATWPETGGNPGAAMPGNVAIRVNKQTAAVRGQRQGRMYLVGAPEGITDVENPNTVVASAQTEITAAFEALRSGLEGSEGPPFGTYTSSPNVVHTINDVFVGKSRILAFGTDPTLSSQRRRLRG